MSVVRNEKMLPIVYIVEQFPSTTEYFILNEILALEHRNVDIVILSIKKPKLTIEITKFADLKSTVFYSSRIFFLQFFYLVNFFKKLPIIVNNRNNIKVRSVFKQLKYLLFATYFEKQLKGVGIKHIHAHFAYIAADVGYLLSKLLNVSFSFTAHAQDIYLNKKNIVKKIENSSFVITCTRYNSNYLNHLTGNKFTRKIYHVYHGIELNEQFNQKRKRNSDDLIFRILTVARLVEKKGIIYLLKALEILINKYLFKVNCDIIGDGPLMNDLNNYAITEEIKSSIRFLGTKSRKEVLEQMSLSDVFVLPSITAANGDIDGLPNVLLEAMIMELPVVSTNLSAIPELIEDGITGFLVPEKDENAIANVIIRLIKDQVLHNSISCAAKDKIIEKFNINVTTDKLIHLFNEYAKN